MNKKHIRSNRMELGDFYRQEADSFGGYKGQYGTRKVPYRTEDGELQVTKQPVIRLDYSVKSFYNTLSPEIRKVIKSYKYIKKSMMGELTCYCNGKVYT